MFFNLYIENACTLFYRKYNMVIYKRLSSIEWHYIRINLCGG